MQRTLYIGAGVIAALLGYSIWQSSATEQHRELAIQRGQVERQALSEKVDNYHQEEMTALTTILRAEKP